MEDNIEEQEIYTIENKKYNVITRVTKQKLSKDNLIKLIARYVIQELQSENLYKFAGKLADNVTTNDI